MSVTYCYIGQDSRCVVGDPVGQDSRCVVGDPVDQDRCVVGDPVGQDSRCVVGDPVGQDRCVVGDPVGQDGRCVVGDPVGQDGRCVVGDPVGQDRCVLGDTLWVLMLCQPHRSYQEEYRLCKAELIFSSPRKVQTNDPLPSEISFNDTGIKLSYLLKLALMTLASNSPKVYTTWVSLSQILSFKQHM